MAIGVILTLIFEAAIRTPSGGEGIGRTRAVFIVLEEAHRYLGDGAIAMARGQRIGSLGKAASTALA
ncbi:hypothetical protein GCM10027282_04010 [Frigoribacterium salinisoli]